MAIAEVPRDVSRNFADPFLHEMELKTWKKSGRLIFLDQFSEVKCPQEKNAYNTSEICIPAHYGASSPCLLS